MKIIKSSIEVEWLETGEQILKRIEKKGRTAYKSHDKITDSSAKAFVEKIMRSGHHSVIEHIVVGVKVICDRGVSHEIVRHRIGSYTQESTRYCNYSDDRFGGQLTFIMPSWTTDDTFLYGRWKFAMQMAEETYLHMIKNHAMPQEARSVLPNSLKTEIEITYNLREWLHFLNLRTAKDAHPDMQVVAKMILAEFKNHIPVIFEDV